MNCKKAAAVDDGARYLVFYPAAGPRIGPDQHADGGRILDAVADELLNSIVAFSLAAFPQTAVVKAPHQGVIWMIDLPGLANIVDAHHVVVVEREKGLSFYGGVRTR